MGVEACNITFLVQMDRVIVLIQPYIKNGKTLHTTRDVGDYVQ